MKTYLTICIPLFLISQAIAQNPLAKQWDYTYGGNKLDGLLAVVKCNDGGFLMGGGSYSDSTGDKTQRNHDTTLATNDYWIVKVNSTGIKQWDKRYGGRYNEALSCMQATTDGGYILGGWSNSDSSGDKSEASRGYLDYWIIKIDSVGNKQWDKRFGTSQYDQMYAVVQCADGGYLLGGNAGGGIDGDKTVAGWGGGDYWIIKTDSLGNKQWDRAYGGTDSELCKTILRTPDGGYIIGGGSNSGIGGDKTQPCWGAEDYWMIKIDAAGNKQWDKRFGGTSIDHNQYMILTNDGGYMICGYSNSSLSGDKTQIPWGGGFGADLWVVKTDSLGIKQWDKRYGGLSAEDEFGSAVATSDGGYLICGSSYSDMGGDKTENNLASEQQWVIKTDANGIKQWDQTILSAAQPDDEKSLAFETGSGCYTFAIMSDSYIGGYKSQNTRGDYDYWIIKFCDTTFTTGMNSSIASTAQLTVYPDPFQTALSFSMQKENLHQLSFKIKNVLGQTVFAEQENHPAGPFTKTMDLAFLQDGIYFLEVLADGERSVRKIIKQ